MLINNDVQFIMRMLEVSGFEAYIVGGAVRNYLLNIPINDYDIATNASPDEIKFIFKDYALCLTGQKHYTIGVIINKIKYEITSYRSEAQYTDFRHPYIIKNASTLKEDLSRRDFTINAMAYNCKVIDYFGGMEDISNRIIRCVNDPFVRFEEDALRIMRALRFSSCLGFEIDGNTKKALLDKKHNLTYISRERLNDELFKMISSEKFGSIFEEFFDVFAVIIPSLSSVKGQTIQFSDKDYSVQDVNISILEEVKNDFLLKLCSVFIGVYYIKHYQLKDFRLYLKDLKLSNKIVNNISTILCNQFKHINTDDYSIKNFLREVNDMEIVDKILSLKKVLYKVLKMERCQNEIEQVIQRIEKIKQNNECYTLSHLAINGNDLIQYGVNNSKEIGKLLNVALENVISGKIENNRDSIYDYLSKKILN